MGEKRQLERWFSVYELSYWALVFITDGAYASFLRCLGYGEAFIGKTLTMLGLTSLILMPLGGFLADRIGQYKVLTTFSALLVCGTICLVQIVPSKTMVFVYAVVGGGFTKLLAGFLDSWITKISKEEPELDYGRIRSMGSISYAIASPLFGNLFSLLGYWTSIPLGILLFVVMLFCALKLRNPVLKDDREEGPSFMEAIRYLFGNRTYMIFLGCSVLMNVTIQSFFAFVGVLVEDVGGTVGTLGIYYFILALFEFFVVRNYSKISGKLGLKKTVTLGMVGSFLKSFLHSLATSVTGIYCATVTQCVSLAITVPSNAVYQRECVEKKYLSTALLVMQTCCSGFVTFLLSSTYGKVAEEYGTGMMLRLFSVFALIAAVLFWFLAPKDDAQEVLNE